MFPRGARGRGASTWSWIGLVSTLYTNVGARAAGFLRVFDAAAPRVNPATQRNEMRHLRIASGADTHAQIRTRAQRVSFHTPPRKNTDRAPRTTRARARASKRRPAYGPRNKTRNLRRPDTPLGINDQILGTNDQILDTHIHSETVLIRTHACTHYNS